MLEGDISEINLVERLVELWHEHFTGAIRFENDGIIKIVYFKGGDILSASTNDRADSIDEILMRAGKVSRDHVKQALAKRKESETLGDALLNLGFITRKELTWARRVQVVGVIRSINAWQSGSFTIVSDYLPKRDEGTLFPLPQVLIELIVTDQDRQKYERLLDGGHAVYEKSADFDETFRRLGLNEDADAIAAAVDGRANAAEIAETSGRDPFNVYRLLHALATLQLLRRAEEPRASLQVSDDLLPAGAVADAANLWDEHDEAVEPEPAVAAPRFDIDEAEAARQPTLEVSIDTSAIPPYEAEPARELSSIDSASAWDEPDETEIAAPVPMPAWDAPRDLAGAVPIPASIEPPADADEEQWGFDEAQIETAHRAGLPLAASSEPEKPRRRAAGAKGRFGLVAALLVLVVVGLAAYGGYLYWKQRTTEAAATAEAARPVQTSPAPASAPVPATTETLSLEPPAASVPEPAATATTSTVAEAAPPAAEPPQVSAPAPRAATPAPPAGSPRAAFEAKAREYAASPAGNFTVQIQILCDVGNLQNVVKAGGPNVWYLPQPIGDRSCFRVLWGHYATRAEAEQGLAAIPADLRDRSAAVKAVPR